MQNIKYSNQTFGKTSSEIKKTHGSVDSSFCHIEENIVELPDMEIT